MRHKYYVFVASKKVGCSTWRALAHDMSKFLPSEWIPYAFTFYDKYGKSRYMNTSAFDEAWIKHQNRNPHHWEYWILPKNDGRKVLQMPNKYTREMVADWMGAGKAITGEWEVKEWYEKNKASMSLHPHTVTSVELILSTLK